MFQGSGQLAKMELVQLVQQNGGVLNGTTRTDYTNYFEVLPKSALELALWLEADRMRGPRITQEELDNQRDVVKNEVRVNVLNRPYGGFPWIDMCERAFRNWHNSHNGYGEFADLDAASLDDVWAFFGDYYSPGTRCSSSSATWIREAFALADRHFGSIEGAPPRRRRTSASRGRRPRRRSRSRTRSPASRRSPSPTHTPERDTPEYLAMGMLHQLLAEATTRCCIASW